MNIGKLDRKITFRQATQTTSGFGDNIETFTDFATVWASRKIATLDERYLSNKLAITEAYIYVTRYVEGVDTNMILVDNDIEYNIVAVDDVHRRTYLEVRVTRVE